MNDELSKILNGTKVTEQEKAETMAQTNVSEQMKSFRALQVGVAGGITFF